MVTTRSKSLGLAANVDVDTAATPARFGRKSKGSSGFDGGYVRLAIVLVHTFLDLLAFNLALVFLPDILRHFKKSDASTGGLFAYCETKIESFRLLIGAPSKQNLTLFGGFLGSLHSYLQFLFAPAIGGLSDVYGRKMIMALSLTGLTLSYLLWSLSATFFVFLMARTIGALIKSSPFLPFATVADVSTAEKRPLGMGLMCAVISIAPIVGGSLYSYNILSQTSQSWYSKPATISLFLIVVDIVLVLVLFKEPLPKEKRMKSVAVGWRQVVAYLNTYDYFQFSAVRNITFKDLKRLRALGWAYFSYTFLCSGLEFVLSFLISIKFGYTNVEQILVYGGIGITKALIQGILIGNVRFEWIQNYITWSLLLAILSLCCIGFTSSILALSTSLFLFALSVSCFMPCIMTTATKYGPSSQRGTVLGILHSLGALARTWGPIAATAAYFLCGPTITFCAGGFLLIIPWSILHFWTAVKT